MSSSYEALRARLFRRRRLGVVLELGRTRLVMDELGASLRDFGFVARVGGTNGKGSTCAFVESIARAAGLSVGRFASPHLNAYQERFMLNGQMATGSDLVSAAEAVDAAGGDKLTFFEYSFVLAWEVFRRASVDLAVFEVGLGGRLDATNAMSATVSCVTGIALDHTGILGDTVAKIAKEKAAIYEPGRAAVVGCTGTAEGRRYLVRHAEEVSARVVQVTEKHVEAVPQRLGLAGAHQRHNAATATVLVEALGLGATVAQIAQGLAQVSLPGRYETLLPGIVVDGAHNPDAALALAEVLRPVALGPITVVLAMSADKDAAPVAAALSPVTDRLVVAQATHGRAMSAEELAQAIRVVRAPEAVYSSIPDAIDAERGQGLLVVCGSLFAVADARAHVLGVETDPA